MDRQPDLIARQLAAATRRAEEYCRRSLITQVLQAAFANSTDCYCQPSALLMRLPRGKVQSVNSIVDTYGGAVVDPATYRLEWSTVVLSAPIPSGGGVVEYVSGYGDDVESVPDQIREGILEYAAMLYEDRLGAREAKYQAGASRTLPAGIVDLWRPFQIELSG